MNLETNAGLQEPVEHIADVVPEELYDVLPVNKADTDVGSFRKALPAAMLAVSITLGWTEISAVIPPTPAAATVQHDVGQSLPAPNALECSAPSPAAISTATHLINEPLNPDFARQKSLFLSRIAQAEGGPIAVSMRHILHEPSKPPANYRQLIQEAHFQVEKDAAKEYHQTVFDPTAYTLKLQEMLYDGEQSAPFTEILQVTQQYMRQFGVDVRLATAEDGIAKDMHAPKADDLDTLTAKVNLLNMVNAFSTMPKEYVRLSDIKTILLTAGEETFTRAYYDAGSQTIVANMSGQITPHGYQHELEHAQDYVQCGGAKAMENDPSYTVFNVGKVYGNPHAPSDESAFNSSKILDQEYAQYSAAASGNMAAAAKTERVLARELEQVGLITDYAGTNAKEDKAELGGRISSPAGWREAISQLTPRIREKFTVLLARLWDYAPNTANYFAAIALRNQTTGLGSPSQAPPIAPTSSSGNGSGVK